MKPQRGCEVQNEQKSEKSIEIDPQVNMECKEARTDARSPLSSDSFKPAGPTDNDFRESNGVEKIDAIFEQFDSELALMEKETKSCQSCVSGPSIPSITHNDERKTISPSVKPIFPETTDIKEVVEPIPTVCGSPSTKTLETDNSNSQGVFEECSQTSSHTEVVSLPRIVSTIVVDCLLIKVFFFFFIVCRTFLIFYFLVILVVSHIGGQSFSTISFS